MVRWGLSWVRQLTYIAVAIIGGAVIDKLGIRKALFIGTIIIGLSAALRYFPNGFIGFLFVVVLFGVGGPLISIGAPKTISMWFEGKARSTAVGIYTTAPAIGGLLALSITNSVIMPLTGYSWKLTFVCYGVLTFIIALLWWFLARDTKLVETRENVTMFQVLSTLTKVPAVRIVIIAAPLTFAIMHGFTSWLPKILENGGMSPATAGYAASIVPFTAVISILIVPQLIPPHLRGRSIMLLTLLVVAGLILSLSTTIFPLFSGLVLYGVTASLVFPLLILILMGIPEVGTRYMGLAGGIFFCAAEVGGFAGPLLVRFLVDLFGTFAAGAYFLSALSLVIFMLMFFLKPMSPSEQAAS
jgi:cyanate permease